MLAFIIFGTRGVTSTVERGQFYCPQCNGDCEYTHKSVRRFFTLYFIPLIPLDRLGEYVECRQCQGTFQTQILEYKPSEENVNVEALFMVAMKQVMIAMLLADGIIDDNEVKELQATYEDLAGVSITEIDLREEIDVIQKKGSDALELVAHLASGLNDKGKEMVVTAAYQIAAADGHIDESERQLMNQIAVTLELTKAHYRGILSGLETA